MPENTTEIAQENPVEAVPEIIAEAVPEAAPEVSGQTTPNAREHRVGGLIAAGLLVLFIGLLTAASLLWIPKVRSFLGASVPVNPAPASTGAQSAASMPTLPANPYGPEDFALDGQYLTCIGGESVLGIDVSTYQKDVDWQQVREAGIDFVIIRLGYRGWKTGALKEDSQAQLHYAGAKAAGLKVGAYFFSQCISVAEAQEEAAYAMSIAQNWELDMPLVFDWEYISAEARTGAMDPQLLTDCAKAFCLTVYDAGWEPMVYFNPNMAKNMIHLEQLSEYRFWLAYYNTEMTFPYKVDMWQYTAKGAVPGISGDVDINLFFPFFMV